MMMLLFSVTIFTSAALLFLIEPMFAKFVLPSFGGTPAVWTGSMMFFQAALLTSYLYVHATTSWLGARRQAVVHLVVVLLPLAAFALWGRIDDERAAAWAPAAGDFPLFSLLGLLAVAIGLPFFAISATNPLIQRWLADTEHPAAKDPYFLYRASNLGSVIGLLGYPLVVERELGLDEQGFYWSWVGYAVLVVLVFASAAVLWRSSPASAATVQEDEELAAASPNPPVGAGGGAPETGAPLAEPVAGGMSSAPTLLRRLRWIGLAFVPSSLMLGVTAFVTTDITPIPLLWVIPLSLYLFSFVIVFSTNQRMPDVMHKVMVGALPLMMALLAVTMVTGLNEPYWLLILLHIFGFFVVAMVLHGELARDRPPVRNLTEFYLWVAVGGVLGGVFNALIAAPGRVFDTVVEYPLAIVLACLFLPGVVLARLLGNGGQVTELEAPEEERGPEGGEGYAGEWLLDPRLLDVVLPVGLALVMLGLNWVIDNVVDPGLVIAGSSGISVLWQSLIGISIGLCLWFAYSANRPIRFGLGIAVVIVVGTLTSGEGALYQDRSFFGVYEVTSDGQENKLSYGSTNHGAQILGQTPPEPITYYHRTGPIGQLFEALPEETTGSRAAMIGLGTGSMACYNTSGQRWDFYEIDPLIESIARDESLFTFLSACPGEEDVILGDARLRLADSAPDGEYGVIVADAFSSDAIPVHLLTREAIDLYFSKLQSDGVLAMHISNRHLELQPVLGNLARDAGLTCYFQFDPNAENIPEKFPSEWVVMARQQEDLGSVPNDPRWQPCLREPDSAVWTDDYSNLLSTFIWN